MTNQDDDEFPLDQLEDAEKARINVQLPRESHADLEFIVDLWNQFNQILGRKRGRPWTVMSVGQRLLIVAINNYLKQHGGRAPRTKEERDDFAKRAIADLKKKAGAQGEHEERERRTSDKSERRKTPPR